MYTVHNESTDKLYKMISMLKTPEECQTFFDDLCTITEIQNMSQRVETLLLLDEGKSYQEITDKLGISTATIGRVSRCLLYGSGGYREMLDKLKKENNDDN